MYFFHKVAKVSLRQISRSLCIHWFRLKKLNFLVQMARSHCKEHLRELSRQIALGNVTSGWGRFGCRALNGLPVEDKSMIFMRINTYGSSSTLRRLTEVAFAVYQALDPTCAIYHRVFFP